MALVDVDVSGLEKRLRELAESVRGSARDVVETEVAHLIEDLIKSTTKPGKQAKRIDRDFYKAFRYNNKSGDKVVNLKELYKVLDSYGKRGKRIPTLAKAVIAEKARHQQRRGFLGAGWLGGGNPSGANKYPSVVNKQPKLGTYKVTESPNGVTVTVTNKVPFARHMKGLTAIIQKAVNKRAGSIKTNLRIMAQTGKKYQFR